MPARVPERCCGWSASPPWWRIRAPTSTASTAAGDLALSNELATAAGESSPEAAAEAWAAADERVVSEGYAIPLGYERRPLLLSERMDAENCELVHPLFGLDLASLCLS